MHVTSSSYTTEVGDAGQIVVRETHIDAAGFPYTLTYEVDSSAAVDELLAQHAIALEAALVQAEIDQANAPPDPPEE